MDNAITNNVRKQPENFHRVYHQTRLNKLW